MSFLAILLLILCPQTASVYYKCRTIAYKVPEGFEFFLIAFFIFCIVHTTLYVLILICNLLIVWFVRESCFECLSIYTPQNVASLFTYWMNSIARGSFSRLIVRSRWSNQFLISEKSSLTLFFNSSQVEYCRVTCISDYLSRIVYCD